MLEQDVEDILILDGHGPGGIVFEDLHPFAKLLHGRPTASRKIRDEIVKTYDIFIMIGQHAMEGTLTGNLNHTQSSKAYDYYKLNGKYIGEIAQFALYNGALGLPLIFLSGDDAACKEAEELIPGITTTSVKKGLSRNSAISCSATEARRRIREGIQKAIKNHNQNPIKPLLWKGPYILEKRFVHTDLADSASKCHGAERIDSKTVRFHSDNIMEILYR